MKLKSVIYIYTKHTPFYYTISEISNQQRNVGKRPLSILQRHKRESCEKEGESRDLVGHKNGQHRPRVLDRGLARYSPRMVRCRPRVVCIDPESP
ncbi:hypothetical protein SK128_021812 [Halocaridina rubra]|uniref:Uncharacterized protein n=1 Tax=Halocaridina rubra TaxID=373956 RepID=A0AAN8WUH7_HALRR